MSHQMLLILNEIFARIIGHFIPFCQYVNHVDKLRSMYSYILDFLFVYVITTVTFFSVSFFPIISFCPVVIKTALDNINFKGSIQGDFKNKLNV